MHVPCWSCPAISIASGICLLCELLPGPGCNGWIVSPSPLVSFLSVPHSLDIPSVRPLDPFLTRTLSSSSFFFIVSKSQNLGCHSTFYSSFETPSILVSRCSLYVTATPTLLPPASPDASFPIYQSRGSLEPTSPSRSSPYAWHTRAVALPFSSRLSSLRHL